MRTNHKNIDPDQRFVTSYLAADQRALFKARMESAIALQKMAGQRRIKKGVIHV